VKQALLFVKDKKGAAGAAKKLFDSGPPPLQTSGRMPARIIKDSRRKPSTAFCEQKAAKKL
jgi:hypothetical protein